VRATVLDGKKTPSSLQDQDFDVTEPCQRPAMSQQDVGRPGIHCVTECVHLITLRLG
jgi:hypothetical protein